MLIQIRQNQLFVLKAIKAAAQSVIIQEKYIASLHGIFGTGSFRRKDVAAMGRANTLFEQCREALLELKGRINKVYDVVAELPKMARAERRKTSREVLKLKGKAQRMLNKVEEAHSGLQVLRKRAYERGGRANELPGKSWTERQKMIMDLGKRRNFWF